MCTAELTKSFGGSMPALFTWALLLAVVSTGIRCRRSSMCWGKDKDKAAVADCTAGVTNKHTNNPMYVLQEIVTNVKSGRTQGPVTASTRTTAA